MISLLLAFHIHVSKRGDGLLPQFLGIAPQHGEVRKPVNENQLASTAVASWCGPRAGESRVSEWKPTVDRGA